MISCYFKGMIITKTIYFSLIFLERFFIEFFYCLYGKKGVFNNENREEVYFYLFNAISDNFFNFYSE